MQTILIAGVPKILRHVPSVARVPLVRHPCYRACLGRSRKGNCNLQPPSENHPGNENSISGRVRPIAIRTDELLYFNYASVAIRSGRLSELPPSDVYLKKKDTTLRKRTLIDTQSQHTLDCEGYCYSSSTVGKSSISRIINQQKNFLGHCLQNERANEDANAGPHLKQTNLLYEIVQCIPTKQVEIFKGNC
ncbi:hypothetical protein TNCV_4906741 [Trichonephila clavipes]|uniref:Uncharacterized protein n=1 Tax=Trichonephila clavipes TaxID=2585209 RepID=A0A8X6V9J5_TRICX|nr:hypothetical protein TNCV_4906741 [Trichonephila clavipes]